MQQDNSAISLYSVPDYRQSQELSEADLTFQNHTQPASKRARNSPETPEFNKQPRNEENRVPAGQARVSEYVRNLERSCSELPAWNDLREKNLSSAKKKLGNSQAHAFTPIERCLPKTLEKAKAKIFKKIDAEDLERLSKAAQVFLQNLKIKSQNIKTNALFSDRTLKFYQNKALRFIRFIEHAGIDFDTSYVTHHFTDLEKIYNDAWLEREKAEGGSDPFEAVKVKQASKDASVLTCKLTEGFGKFFFDGEILTTAHNKPKDPKVNLLSDPPNSRFPTPAPVNTRVAVIPPQQTQPARFLAPPVVAAQQASIRTDWVDQLLCTYDALADKLKPPF